MRFSFKKALATVLSIALVLSTCVCALTVGAATLAGSIDIPDAEVELVDGKFTTTATINFDKAYEISYVAYQLDLPEDVTLVGADSTVEGTEFQVDLEKDLILVHYASSIQTIPVRMTFATALLSGSFDIAIAAAEFAEATEAALTLDFSNKGTITIGHDCVAGEPQIENNVDPTCTTAGSYDTVTRCTVCNEIISSVHTDVDALGHAYDDGVVTTTPDCVNDGVKTYTCGVCGDKKTEAVSATGHTAGAEVTENKVDATCTTDGSYDTVVYCSVCNAELSRETTTVEAPGHDYVDGKCDVCGEADPDYVPPVEDCEGNHIYTSVKENITDTTFDSVTYCSACRLEIARYTIDIPQGAVLDENIVPSGHTTSVGETVGIGFRAKLSSLPEADSYKIYVVRNKNAGSYMFGKTDVTIDMVAKAAALDAVLFNVYYGIELYSFTVPVTYMFLCCDAEGNVTAYSNPFTTTVEEICEDYHDLSSTGDKAKTLHADLINLAAATQKYFAHRNPTSDYATKLVLPSFDSSYASKTIAGAFAPYDSTEGLSLTVSTAISQSPYFTVLFSGDATNKDKYSLKVSFYNKVKKDTIVTEISGSQLGGSGNTITCKFEALPLYAGDSDVTFELYEEGNATPIGVRHFCLDKHMSDYLTKNANSTNATTVLLLDIWDAAAKYGQAHRALRNITYVPEA